MNNENNLQGGKSDLIQITTVYDGINPKTMQPESTYQNQNFMWPIASV